MNYNHLYYFHTVARLGSQAAAARELGLRQSTVSEQVRQVEKLLGRKLFERTNAGLRLTDAGRTCLNFTETMFGAADGLMEAFDRQKTPRTVVEVGITSSVSRSFAADFLLPLFDDDALMPRIRHGTSAELMQKLSTSELDVVLSDSKPASPAAERLQTDLAMNLRLLLVGQHADHAAKHGLRFVHFTSGSAATSTSLENPTTSRFFGSGVDGLCRVGLEPSAVRWAVSSNRRSQMSTANGSKNRVCSVFVNSSSRFVAADPIAASIDALRVDASLTPVIRSTLLLT